ncbi:MAG: hypothetical protein EPO09_04075 [Aquabacterium sp.]|uniref:hypothetical protein n=1 Tax=Aquabacterium sp. TaxID=1872578 RepID=UPI0011FD8884|nr:hypothetical protein [Aquabacterium sp.]TAK97395.1 MAG: hypothetical protein EPO09_04075 [Aquabacterium sp.]
MKMSFAIRSLAVTTMLSAAAVSAHADLKIPFGWTQSNSVQKFPAKVLELFDLVYLEINAKGNATSLNDVPHVPVVQSELAVPKAQSYSLPVTEIVIGSKLNIAAGSAIGSALEFRRALDDGSYVGVTLANFTLNYVTKKVWCDAKASGAVSKHIAVYDFHVATPLALKYKFPLTVTGHEVLDKLMITADGKQVFTDGLQLEPWAAAALNEDMGTLTQDISTNIRKPALKSTKPYVPAM